MQADFDSWLRQVAPGMNDPGTRPPLGATEFLCDVFERLGPISGSELSREAAEAAARLAQAAVELVLKDLHGTTEARPVVEVRRDEEYGLVISYNSGYTTPAFKSLRHPEATCEIADYLQGEIVDDLWTVWPTCPSHRAGLDARADHGEAAWRCRAENHMVALIGRLSSA